MFLAIQRPEPRFGRSFVFAALAAVLTLGGCTSAPKTFEIRGEADQVINRDAAGKPLSVAVRLYQLKTADEFSKLTFDTLASGRSESDLLGPDLIEKKEVILVPGAKYVGTEKLAENAKYVGVVAFFRQPDPHYWRFLVEADKVRSEGFTFRVQDCYLKLLNLKPSAIPGQPAELVPACSNSGYRPAMPTQGSAASGQVGKRPGAASKGAKTETSTPP